MQCIANKDVSGAAMELSPREMSESDMTRLFNVFIKLKKESTECDIKILK